MKVTLALNFFENFYYNIILLIIINSGVDTIPFINCINFLVHLHFGFNKYFTTMYFLAMAHFLLLLFFLRAIFLLIFFQCIFCILHLKQWDLFYWTIQLHVWNKKKFIHNKLFAPTMCQILSNQSLHYLFIVCWYFLF